MHFLHVADLARPDNFAGCLGALVVPALIAHLGRNLVLHGGVRQQLRFPRRPRQRFLAVDVLAVLHGEPRDRRVHVIGRGDHHRVDVLALGLEHLAIVFVLIRLRILREAARRTLLVDVAHRDDVLSGRRADQNRRAARSHSDRANV